MKFLEKSEGGPKVKDYEILMEKFKNLIQKEYPKIKLKGVMEEDLFNIYYYLEEFDVKNDKRFRSIFGNCLEKTFYKHDKYNISSEYLLKDELKEYFPEEHKKENETFEITLLYEKDPVLSQIFQKITRLLDNYNKVSEYSNKIKDTTVFYNKIEAKNKKRTTSLKIDFKRTRNLKFREIPHPSIIESESLNVEYVK